MNILIVAADFKPSCGGVAEYTHHLALQMHKAGDNVTVLSKKMKNDEAFDSDCSYKVYRSKFRFLSSGSIRKYTEGYKWLKIFAKNQRPIDIIISNCYGILSIITLAVSKSLNIPFTILAHGSEINRKGIKDRFKIKYVLRRSAIVFCNSTYTKRLVVKFGVPHDRIAVVPGGISIDELSTLDGVSDSTFSTDLYKEKKKVILTCGRLVERKGHDKVIEAMPQITQKISNVVYLIAGEGPYEERLKRLVHEHKLKDSVIFTGWVSDQRQRKLYDLCDVFVMPCRELDNGEVEGFGLVFLEANAFRKPAIAGRSGGAPDAVEHNKTGLLVNPLSTDEIANAVIYLLSHPRVAERMGKTGRKRVENELNWGMSGAKMRKSLMGIIRNP